jgi:hypothetical protein
MPVGSSDVQSPGITDPGYSAANESADVFCDEVVEAY